MGIGLVLSEHKPNRAFKYLKFGMFFVWLGCGFGSIFLVIKKKKKNGAKSVVYIFGAIFFILGWVRNFCFG